MVDGVNQQPGLFQRIGNFFGQDDPNAGTPTDPFSGLSRSQRTMLGFAALRDAASSLEGRDSNFFQGALGGFEQARDRERLRTQGEMQNRVGALQALATLNEQLRFNNAFGLPTDPATDALRSALMEAAGLGSGAAVMAGGVPSMPSMPTAGTPSTRPPTGPQVMDASGAVVGDIADEPLSPTAQAAMAGAPMIDPADAASVVVSDADPRLAEIDARQRELLNQMTMRSAAQAPTDDLMAELNLLNDEAARIRGGAAAAETAAAEAAARARPAGTAAGIAIREADDMLLALGFDPETGQRTSESQVAGPRARLAARTPAGEFVTAGGPTADFLNNMQSLKDTVAIQRLLEIKEAGAGLGAIPQSQLEALARALGNLNVSSSDEVLARNLRDIRRLYEGVVERSLSDSNDPTFRGLVRDIAAPPRGGPAVDAGVGAIGLTPEQQALVDRYSR